MALLHLATYGDASGGQWALGYEKVMLLIILIMSLSKLIGSYPPYHG
jgi:hypothetical protein